MDDHYLPVFLWNHVKMRFLISTNGRLGDLIIAVILKLSVFNLIRNLAKTKTKNINILLVRQHYCTKMLHALSNNIPETLDQLHYCKIALPSYNIWKIFVLIIV